MRNKIIKIVFEIIAVTMLLTIICWAIRTYLKNPFQTKTVKSDDITMYQTENKDAVGENKPQISKWIGMLPNDTNVYDMGETFEIEYFSQKDQKAGTLECQVKQVEFTKKNPDTDAIYYAASAVAYDEGYNITNDFTYIVADVVFRNKEETEMEIYVNWVKYIGIVPETGDVDENFPSGEVQGYKTSTDQPDYEKSYAKVIIPGREEYRCKLVYIQKDEAIQGKEPYLRFSASGTILPPDEETCYVKVG